VVQSVGAAQWRSGLRPFCITRWTHGKGTLYWNAGLQRRCLLGGIYPLGSPCGMSVLQQPHFQEVGEAHLSCGTLAIVVGIDRF